MSEIAIKTEKFDEQDELGQEDEAEEVLADGKSQPTVRRTPVAMRPTGAVIRNKNACYPMVRNAVQGRQQTNTTSSAIVNSNSKSTLPKTRCGEVFVSNNARQWTFICTYCNKSTRDIGEFICHIRMKHLAGCYDEDDDSEDVQSNQADAYEQEQDYFDCGNYLDVNVHTESEEITYNGQEQSYTRSPTVTNRALPAQQQPLSAPRVQSIQKTAAEPKQSKSSILLHRLNATDNVNDSVTAHSTSQRSIAGNSNINSVIIRSNYLKKSKENTGNVNGDVSQATTDYDDADELDVHNPFAAYEDEEDEDFDNQLLITPNDSLDASGVGVVKGKRRQIRGTAYCALCNRTFQYYSLYRNHMIKHSNETPFKCSLCKKGFKSKQAIRYHMNTHKKEKQFKCTICEAAYCTENQFITHVLTHENETTFPCMVCGAILHSEKERDVHWANHSEDRPFRCEFCYKLFRLRHHLSNHLKMHRQYRCDYCKEEFTSAVHQRKPYACENCENLPEVRQQAANAEVNPLQIFETIVPTSGQEPGEVVEMLTDSDEEQEREHADEDDDMGEEEDGDVDDGDGEEVEDDDDVGSYRHAAGHGESGYAGNSHTKKRFACKYCHRTYSHVSGLNYHMRNKH